MPKSPEHAPESPRRTPEETPSGAVISRKPRSRKPAPAVATFDSDSAIDGGKASLEDPLVALLKNLVRSAGPAFVISVAVHLVLLGVLAFVVIRHERPRSLATTLRAFNPAGLDLRPENRQIAPVAIELPRADVEEVPAGKPKLPSAETPAGEPDVHVTSPTDVSVSGALGGRTFGGSGAGGGAGGRGALLAAQGGTEKTEQAVSSGLAWLSRLQRPDGHWELHQGYPDAGQLRTSTGATALALLAFLGAGHTHREGLYKDKVGKGLRFLIGTQKKGGPLKGDFYDFDREGDAASFYAHGQATIALCEAYALTRDDEFLPAIQAGLAFLCDAQHPVTGGWKYRRQAEGDLSVFGWQIMALESARMAGLEVPGEVLERAVNFLDLVQEAGGARYRYEPHELKSSTPAMTAEGLLCRQYLGWPRDHPAMIAGARYLVEPENLPDWDSGRRNIYHWYYASQVLHNLQGAGWESWNAALRDELVKSQVKGGGKVGGSWNPFQPAGAIDENADKGGRLYVTCLCLLTLEVYYRHLPLYRDAP